MTDFNRFNLFISVILVHVLNLVAGHIENMKIQFYMHLNIITSPCFNHRGKN